MKFLTKSIQRACLLIGALSALTFFPRAGLTQLAECAQINEAFAIDAPGGCIERTLDEQIGAGQGDEFTPSSSIYLIKRDPARSIRRGRQLFQRKFTMEEGNGPRVNFSSRGDVTISRALGAGMADSCAACHGRPRGAAGHGGDVATFPDSRDAPHLFGLGLIEMLADEMTSELRTKQDNAIAKAVAKNRRQIRRMTSKGTEFGRIIAYPDGHLDSSGLEGIDADLRVKPLFHEGRRFSIREFIVGAFNDEMGLQAWDPVLCAASDPVSPQRTVSAAGFVFDPAIDSFNRPPACDARDDPDLDGIAGEIDPALVDHLEFYLLNYFKPGQYKVTNRASRGLALMKSIGCTSCHTQDMTVQKDRRVADVETRYDPQRGIFNDLYAEASLLLSEHHDGYAYPQLLPNQDSFVVRNVFSDLKRHDLGPEFEERDFDGTRITMHITEPLWGVGSSAPYGHDGRSINLDAVIRRHGGEASEVTRAYGRLKENQRGKIIEFLQTLVLFPPDDTASNLKPGNPGSDDPQNPDNHGSINLGALFAIPSEGVE